MKLLHLHYSRVKPLGEKSKLGELKVYLKYFA